ncbi:hypothetical protein JG687_00011433 [Phytophthora cactorum]|uniref:Uncharacterized protein n=1 Tax=Phytophthora cactorum TaxID=29920 RepID=A0A8T1U9S3_9STRA|nr:hypothetical protein JG687_00011433 [Phytophthora cactorum]
MLTILQSLPKTSTLVCKPLDVGVVGQFKANLKELWMLEPPSPPAPKKWRKKAQEDRQAKTLGDHQASDKGVGIYRARDNHERF